MNRPLISVCVATYNQAAYVADCVASVLAQRGPFDLEVLVGDDGSIDESASILREIADQSNGVMTLYAHTQNIGGTHNYQFLIERARGDFVAHLDGDDYWLPGKLHAQMAFMEEHPQCVAVYANALVVSPDRTMLGVFTNRQPDVFDEGYLLARGNFLNHSSLFYRAAERYRLLDLPGNFVDYRMHLRLARGGELGFVNAPLVGYRISVVNSITTATPERVRNLYWEALAEACVHRELDAAAVSGLAMFVAVTAAQTLSRRSPKSWLHWTRLVMRTFPSVRWAVAAASFGYFCLLLSRSLRNGLVRWLAGTGLRVYFFR